MAAGATVQEDLGCWEGLEASLGLMGCLEILGRERESDLADMDRSGLAPVHLYDCQHVSQEVQWRDYLPPICCTGTQTEGTGDC